MKTIKYFLQVSVIICINLSVYSQVYQQWVNTLNGTINNEDIFIDAAADDSANVYVTGTVYNSTTGKDIVVRKYNPEGALAWENIYSSPIPDGQDGGVKIIYKNNFVYIIGDTKNASTDIIVFKRNAATGALIWSTIFNGPANQNDHAYSMAIDNADNVYVVGMSYTTNYDFEMLVVKFNPSGGHQWTEISGWDGFDFAGDVAVDNSGNVYVCGRDAVNHQFSQIVTMKFQPDGSPQWFSILDNGVDSIDAARQVAVDAQGNIYTSGYVRTLSQGYDMALVKYNPNGNQLWVRYYNGSSNGNDVSNDMKLDASGNIYLTGYSHHSASQLDYMTVKYSSAGTKLWEARYIGNYLNGDNIAHSITLDAENNVYITGRSEESASGSDIVTVKYNSSGTSQWVLKNNGSVNAGFIEFGYSIALDNLKNVYVAGKNDADDGIIIKYVQAPIGIQPLGNEIPKQFELTQNYPNPFNPNTNIEFSLPQPGLVKLAVYDMLGREVSVLINQDLNAGRYKYDFSGSALSSGVYFYRLEANGFSEVKKMNLIK
jgi:uncharacterized delta-60 repeat protein